MSDLVDRVRYRLAFNAFALWKRNHEPELKLLPALCRRPGIAIDVGAHKGLYTYYLSRLCASVYAFEPIPSLARRLRLGAGRRVRVEEVALSRSRTKRTIKWPAGNFSWSTIEPDNQLEFAESAIHCAEVETRALDDYGLTGATFLKIDVEGHECSVIEGATRTLRESRPNLLVEVEERHKPGALDAVRERLAALDYLGFFLDGQRLRPMSELVPDRDQPLANVSRAGKSGRYINNFVFAPREHQVV